MDTKYLPDPIRFERMTTDQVRNDFLLQDLFQPEKITLYYVDSERAVVGGIVPMEQTLVLTAGKELASEYFAERREVGIFNTGDSGMVTVDGTEYELDNRDCLYIGRGAKDIQFSSKDSQQPAYFYLLSYPAHTDYPTTLTKRADVQALELGSQEDCNRRNLYKYIYPDGVKSCQLVMGFTELVKGSIWNTMPVHTHARRTEIYMYFDVPQDHVVFHLTGKPDATKHVVVRNRQAMLSPSWSIHSGAGTSNYAFIWGMGGENQAFDDMDWVPMEMLK